MHTEGHDMGKDTAGNTKPAGVPPPFDAEHPGYETTDVKVGGIAVFLAGLFGVVIIFFFFCFGMGRVINNFFDQAGWRGNQVGDRVRRATPGQGRGPGEQCGDAAARADGDD